MELENATQTDQKSPEKDRDEYSGSSKKKRAGRYGVRLAESRDNRRGSQEKSAEDKRDKPKTPWEFFSDPPAKVKTASKEEVPDEDRVSESEKPVAVRALAEEEANAISGESAEDLAAKDFLEEASDSGDIEAAAATTAAKIGANAEDISAMESQIEEAIKAQPETELEPEEEAAQEGPEPEAEASQDQDVEEIVFDRAAEQIPQEPEGAQEDEPADAATTPPPAQPPVGSSGGGKGLPPRDPRSPFGPGLPPLGPAAIPTQSGNLYHTPITPNSLAVERYDQGNPAVMALMGGIVGYFIGRRRGRIKTEKKLIPIQKKLEKQVEDLHWEIKRKEMAVRRVAAEKARQNGPLVVEKLVSGKTAKSEKPRQAAPEAHQLHGAEKAHEHLGHMLITAEAVDTKREKRVPEGQLSKPETPKMVEKLPENLTGRHVETLNRSELLALSDRVMIDGTSLRQIYETHLIGERGLRRLLAEHLQGGDVKKILRHEIVEHEIDFERDPVLRDLTAHTPAASSSTSIPSKATLDKLVEQASASLGDGQSSAAAYYKARAVYEAQQQVEEGNKRRLVDIGLVTVISVLVAVIVGLYLTRH